MPAQTDSLQQLDIQDFDLHNFCKKISKNRKTTYVLVSKNPKETFKTLKDGCTAIRAAGGLVLNGKGNYLFIFRNKRWDLPKGKAEKGEEIKETAVREVEEECGVKISRIGEKLCKTYHIYTIGNKIVLKKTNWYAMNVKSEPKLIPQKEEGIEKAVWLNSNELSPIIRNTFPSILDVLSAGKLM